MIHPRGAVTLPSRTYTHKPIFSKRLAIKHTLPYSQNQTSQTQLIRTNAIRTPIPLHHTQLIILILPTRRPAAYKPLLPSTLHFSKPSRIRTAIAPSPRPPTLIRGGIIRLRFILRSVYRQTGRGGRSRQVCLRADVVLECGVELFLLTRCCDGRCCGGVGVCGFWVDGSRAGDVF